MLINFCRQNNKETTKDPKLARVQRLFKYYNLTVANCNKGFVARPSAEKEDRGPHVLLARAELNATYLSHSQLPGCSTNRTFALPTSKVN